MKGGGGTDFLDAKDSDDCDVLNGGAANDLCSLDAGLDTAVNCEIIPPRRRIC